MSSCIVICLVYLCCSPILLRRCERGSIASQRAAQQCPVSHPPPPPTHTLKASLLQVCACEVMPVHVAFGHVVLTPPLYPSLQVLVPATLKVLCLWQMDGLLHTFQEFPGATYLPFQPSFSDSSKPTQFPQGVLRSKSTNSAFWELHPSNAANSLALPQQTEDGRPELHPPSGGRRTESGPLQGTPSLVQQPIEEQGREPAQGEVLRGPGHGSLAQGPTSTYICVCVCVCMQIVVVATFVHIASYCGSVYSYSNLAQHVVFEA